MKKINSNDVIVSLVETTKGNMYNILWKNEFVGSFPEIEINNQYELALQIIGCLQNKYGEVNFIDL